ncbi:MAG: tetratricopeptide repeat protein [Lentimicrobiaceae bacterium]|nr:tetratricopeptide repeat protein [Lentimicrobiaceae bacterium]
MKSIKYTLVSLLLLVCTKGFSCLYPTYSPGEYFMFYAYDASKIKPAVSLNEKNIEQWRKLIKNQASTADIKEVVYRYSIGDMEKIAAKKITKNDSLYKNSFVRYLQSRNNTEIVDFLILAKRCEAARAKRADKWWYPTKEDLNNYDLQVVLDEALAYKGVRLKSRYLLQAVRAAYTMGNYDLCLNLWEDQIKKLPSSAVKTMCMGYIGGIWFRKGNYEKAIQFYNESNDQASFWWCAKYLTTEYSYVERIKILYQYQPSSEELAFMVQDICRNAEVRASNYVFNNKIKKEMDSDWWDSLWGYKSFQANRKQYIELRDFALRAAAENRSNNPAMWQYTAAFLTFLHGKTSLAVQYAEKAAQLDGTPFIKEKIRVLQIMLDAYATKNYDKDFETRIFPQLQWLDSLIVRDIDMKGAYRTIYDGEEWYGNNNKTIKETYSDWDTKANYSQYYPFDMMRKIVLSVMLPKYQRQKDYTKALLLAGMASERLRMLVNFKHINEYNPEYSTDIFNYMNDFPIENVIEYQQLLQTDGRNEFEQFLTARCYKNDDYFNELIGTKYLRLEQFEDAVSYLSKVPAQYVKSMNVYWYFRLDPFREVYEWKYQKPYPAYKLNFAKKMLKLQQTMQTEQNKEKKAAAMWQYAVALERSVLEEESWALTEYYMGKWWFNEGNYDYHLKTRADRQQNFLKRSKKLIAQAGKTMENSKNPTIRAKYDWYKNVEPAEWDWRAEVWRPSATLVEFAKRHNNISALRPFLSECDVFQSYFISQYLNEKWTYTADFNF